MKKKFFLFFILVSIFIISCSSENVLQILYAEEDYISLIETAQKECKKEVTDENLYYLMMGYYGLQDFEKATEVAYLYQTLFPTINNYRKGALTILMYNDDSISAYHAAKELVNNYTSLTLTDYTLFFKLASKFDKTNAITFYNEISTKLSNKDKLTILADSSIPIINIITALESYYQETEGNEEYQKMLTRILENYSKQDVNEDALVLLSLANDTINDNPKGEIYLGDLYYKLGYKTAASKHWNAALVDYPAEVKSRLFKYK